MLDRSVLRVGAGAAMLGGVLLLVFNLLHPRSAEVDSVAEELALVADSDIWLVDHFMLVWAIAIAFVGFVAIARSFEREPSVSWGRLAFGATIAGVAIGVLTVMVDGMATKAAADNWAEAGRGAGTGAFAAAEAVAHIGIALFTGVIGWSFGVTPILFGLAQLTSDVYPRWLGYVAVAAGVVGLVTASIQYLAGISAATAGILFPVASLAFTVWLIASGRHLWNLTAAPAAQAVTAP